MGISVEQLYHELGPMWADNIATINKYHFMSEINIAKKIQLDRPLILFQ